MKNFRTKLRDTFYRDIIQKDGGKITYFQIIGLLLIFIGLIYFVVKIVQNKTQCILPDGIAISFFITMLGVAFAFPDLLNDQTKGISTMRIITFMFANVICMILLKIGWDKHSLSEIGLDGFWMGVIAFLFGAKATQKYFENAHSFFPNSPLIQNSNDESLTNIEISRLAVIQNKDELLAKHPNIESVSGTLKNGNSCVTIYVNDNQIESIPKEIKATLKNGSVIKVETEIVADTGDAKPHIGQTTDELSDSNSPNYFGSICCIVESISNNNFKGVVTAGHVFTYGDYYDYGGVLGQNQKRDVLLNGNPEATLFFQQMKYNQDIAIAEITDKSNLLDNYISFNSGFYEVSDRDLNSPSPNVTIASRLNNKRDAFILDFNISFEIKYFNSPRYIRNIILIGSTNDRTTSQTISVGGDSGGCVYHKATGKLIGLLLGEVGNSALFYQFKKLLTRLTLKLYKMKSLIIIQLLFVSIFAFSQGSKITYDVQNGIPVRTDAVTNLKLPLILSFTDKFNGRNIKFLSDDGTQPLALNNAKFGSGDLTKDGETNQFIIIINTDKSVNPGDEKINFDKFILKIDNVEFPIALSTVSGSSGNDELKKEEEYEAGYIYYDVMKLLDKKTIPQTKQKILNAYGVTKDSLKNNPYLNDIYGKESEKDNLPQGGEVSSLLGSIGNTDVTYFAAGLARFLAERTKEELNEAFFNKMKRQLNAYPELTTVFPKTASFLNIIESYSYASVIQVLKEAFETDIQNLPENLYNIKSLSDGDCDEIAICGKDKDCNDYTDCQARLKNLEEFFSTQDGHWIALGMFSLKEGIQSSNPADLLKSITSSTEFTDLKTISTKNNEYDDFNIVSSIELSNYISQSLISTDDSQVWISTSQLNELFKTNDAFKIYLGLLLAKELKGDVKIEFYNSTLELTSFGEVLSYNYSTYSQFESLIKNTHAAYNATNNAVKKLIAVSEKSIEADPQVLYTYYRTLTSSLKPIANNPALINLVGKDIGASYDNVVKFLDPSVDIAYHISTKKYSAAIYDASILLSALNNYTITIPDKNGKAKVKKYDGFETVTKSFVKYGTLISTVANSQSSEEVKQALDASVLPVGSSSIKRNSNWSFSINSYVGAYWNYNNSNDYPSLGLSAPVGFNVSKGLCKTGNWGSLGLNLQIIDLGALVNYYLIEGDTASLPNDFNIKLSNIFAPGFNLSYNVPKTPLSLACGGQYIPTIYKYELINEVNELVPTSTFKWQISILIDIPLYNLKVWDYKK